MKANDFLENALSHLKERGEVYDKKSGERSIQKVVDAFYLLTGHALTYEQGWMFMILLKLVRSQQGKYKSDNYEDAAAYCALMGETGITERKDDRHE